MIKFFTNTTESCSSLRNDDECSDFTAQLGDSEKKYKKQEAIVYTDQCWFCPRDWFLDEKMDLCAMINELLTNLLLRCNNIYQHKDDFVIFLCKKFFFSEILSPQSLYSKVILIMKVFRNLHQLLLAPPGFSWPTLFPGKLGETKTNYFFRTWTWSENQLIVMNQAVVVVVVEFYLQSSVCCVRVRNVESNLVWQIWQAGNSAVSFALHNLVLSSCSHDLVNAIQVNFYCPIIFQL